MFHRSFTDFDEFAAQAQRWALDLKQLDSGPFLAEHTQFEIGDIQISEAKFGRTIRQHGAPPSELRTVVVPAQSDFDFEWRGARVDGNSLMIFPEGAELDAVSKGNFHVFTCSFFASQLENAAHSLGISGLDALKGEVARCAPEQIGMVRNLLRQLCTQVARDQESLGDTELNESVRLELPIRILRAASASDRRLGGDARSTERARIVESAEDYINRRAADTLTVAEVCDAVKTSSRTLQLAFADRFGISPKAYIRSIRLNQVRKELIAARPGHRKVADIANAWGFWHLGQFAADYRRMFCELPSATLQRKK